MRAIVFNGKTAEIRNDVEVRDPGRCSTWIAGLNLGKGVLDDRAELRHLRGREVRDR